ncbi:hypothetical protein SDC9_193443 [bioreactor metagenome]|uniref:Uncharacterized protein n=1 Tax=bioreactor metagenome TaxID=1076179 RepID=A0A645I3N7_9ZZZZ
MQIHHDGVAVGVDPAKTDAGQDTGEHHARKEAVGAEQEERDRHKHTGREEHGGLLDASLQQRRREKRQYAADVDHTAHDALGAAGEMVGVYYAVHDDALEAVGQAKHGNQEDDAGGQRACCARLPREGRGYFHRGFLSFRVHAP